MHFEKIPTPMSQGISVAPNHCAMVSFDMDADYGIKLDGASGEPFGILPGTILCIKRATHIPDGKIVAAINHGETVVGQIRDGKCVFHEVDIGAGNLQLLGIVAGTVIRL